MNQPANRLPMGSCSVAGCRYVGTRSDCRVSLMLRNEQKTFYCLKKPMFVWFLEIASLLYLVFRVRRKEVMMISILEICIVNGWDGKVILRKTLSKVIEAACRWIFISLDLFSITFFSLLLFRKFVNKLVPVHVLIDFLLNFASQWNLVRCHYPGTSFKV